MNDIQTRKMVSPINKDLPLTLFVGNEGLTHHYKGTQSFEGVMTVKEFVEQFSCEKNSDLIDESEKMQRDVSEKDPRVKCMVTYVKKGASIFPNVTIFLNYLVILENIKVGCRDMVIASIHKDADRHITDGQGRHTTASIVLGLDESELINLNDFANHTISVKLVITNTETIYEARKMVRQVFSDYHIALKKPNSSISLYFDSSTPYGLLMNELMESELEGKPMHTWVASKGRVTGHQAWSLAQFANFVHTALGKTKSSLNKDLLDEDCYLETRNVLVDLLPMLISKLPLNSLINEEKGSHSKALFTKALFLTGFGYLVRSAIEDSLISGELNIEAFDQLQKLPLANMFDDSLREEKIVDENGKIISHSSKRIGSYLCNKIRIMPCALLTA